jgi:Hemopexin
MADKITHTGPYSISEKWLSLRQAGFSSVDAVMPVPNVPNQLYFFRGKNYVRINFNNDSILAGPYSIVDKWVSLRKAGFATVDAVYPHPTVYTDAYFFRGTKYVRINVVDDTIRYNGPHTITDRWASLRNAGFTCVDTVLPHPTELNDVFFFYRDQYVRINFNEDTIHYGPSKTATAWKSLHAAGFY